MPTLAADAQAVNDAAYDLAEVIDGLSVNQNELLSANDLAADYRLAYGDDHFRYWRVGGSAFSLATGVASRG